MDARSDAPEQKMEEEVDENIAGTDDLTEETEEDTASISTTSEKPQDQQEDETTSSEEDEFRPRWERELSEDEEEGDDDACSLSELMANITLNGDFFNSIFGKDSDAVLKKIVAYLDFGDMVRCCKTSEIWKAKLIQFHDQHEDLRRDMERKKAVHDWISPEVEEEGSEATAEEHEVVIPGTKSEKFSVKQLLCDDGGTVFLLLECQYDANSPNFLDEPIEYVVVVWNCQAKEEEGRFSVNYVDLLVKSICISDSTIFLRYSRPKASKITLLSRAGKEKLNFSCEVPGSKKAFPVDEFHARGSFLFAWSKESGIRKYAVLGPDETATMELKEEIGTGDDGKCSFSGGKALTASKHDLRLWNLSDMSLSWTTTIPHLIASIALSESRAVVEGLSGEYTKTSVMMYNREDGKLFKGVTLVNNDTTKVMVSGNYVFVNFLNSEFRYKLLGLDLRTGEKVLEKDNAGNLLSVDVWNDEIATIALGNLKAKNGSAEVHACLLRSEPQHRLERMVKKEEFDFSKDYQRVLNHQSCFFASRRGIVRDCHGSKLRFQEVVKPINFKQYVHEHEGCAFHGKTSSILMEGGTELDFSDI